MQLFRIINIMPTTNVDQRVKRMSDQEVVTLDGIGITTKDDLRYVEFVDLANTIPVIKRRKLNMIESFVCLVDQKIDNFRTINIFMVNQDGNRAGKCEKV